MMSRRRRAFAGLALAVALAAGGCSKSSYFPLDSGHSWTHRITFEPAVPNSRTPPPFEGVIRNLAAQPFDGMESVTQVASVGDNHSETVLRGDSTGVRVLATKRAGQEEPEREEGLRYILRYPVTVGTEWPDEGEPRFFEQSHKVPGTSRIVAIETVTVPAGTYRDAAKVVFQGSDTIELPGGGLHEITIDATGWYAPGVGLVRYEQVDTADDETLSGRFRIELLRFNQL
jgi:hypothetical protein